MEQIINIVVIAFSFLVVLIVERVLYRAPLTKKYVSDYQATLDASSRSLIEKHGIVMKHDAMTQIKKNRREKKGMILMCSCFLLVFLLIFLAFMSSLTLANIGVIVVSAFLFLVYAIIKFAESKIFAIVLLSSVIAMGLIFMFLLDKAMALSPYSFGYLVVFVILIGTFSLGRQAKKA